MFWPELFLASVFWSFTMVSTHNNIQSIEGKSLTFLAFSHPDWFLPYIMSPLLCCIFCVVNLCWKRFLVQQHLNHTSMALLRHCNNIKTRDFFFVIIVDLTLRMGSFGGECLFSNLSWPRLTRGQTEVTGFMSCNLGDKLTKTLSSVLIYLGTYICESETELGPLFTHCALLYCTCRSKLYSPLGPDHTSADEDANSFIPCQKGIIIFTINIIFIYTMSI